MAYHHIGQRASLKGQLCTVRYVGPVRDKPGEWLGVEWDDPARGKHDGTHENVKYFECRRTQPPEVASFLKPSTTWDRPRTFLQALREKYMPEDASTGSDFVYFSSKKAEEVGFEKFARRQAHLQGIYVLVLDYMRMQGNPDDDEKKAIKELCGHSTELDLSCNLFESLDEVICVATLLPKLSSLTLDGNRLTIENVRPKCVMPGIRSISLSNTYLSWSKIALALKAFPNSHSLFATHNGLSELSRESLPHGLRHLYLSENEISHLADLRSLCLCTNLETIVLKNCKIMSIWPESAPLPELPLSHSVTSIDLSYNQITSWRFFNSLASAYPALKHLYVGGNPLFKDLKSAEGKYLTSEDGYMLTIARLPHLKTLNYSNITEKERLNAEVYYLSQIASELAISPAEREWKILSEHPRWRELCDEYGEPAINRGFHANTLDPNSLAAHLVSLSLELSSEIMPSSPVRTWTDEVPNTCNIYALLGIIGKRLDVMPLKLRLVWKTGERDPAEQSGGHSRPEWWDSSDEEDASVTDSGLVLREVELVPGTRAVGTYIEGRQAVVRVEMRSDYE